MTAMETKTCSKCKRVLPADLTHFFSNGNTKSGLSSQCKECMGCRFKESAYSGITNPNEEKKCTACKRIFPKTSEYFQKANNGYLHPKCRECSSVEYAAKQGKAGILTNVQFKALKKYFGGGCAYCESRMKVLYKDLIIPEYLGGKPEKGNVIPVCMSCRNSRNDDDLEKWYRRQLFFTEEKLKKIYGLRENETKPKEVKTMNFEEITKKYQESANKGHCVRTLAAENGVFKSDIICELFKSGYQYLELKRAFPSDYAAALKKFEKWTKGEAQEPVKAEPKKEEPAKEEPVKEEAPEQEEEIELTDEEIHKALFGEDNEEALNAIERHEIEVKPLDIKAMADELAFLRSENTKLDEENIKLTQENSELKSTLEKKDASIQHLLEENASLKKSLNHHKTSDFNASADNMVLESKIKNFEKMNSQLADELADAQEANRDCLAELNKEKKKRKKLEKALLKYVTR